jgi:hypothetical protein
MSAGWSNLQNKPDLRMDVAHVVEFAMAFCTGYRRPAPTRWAHKVAGGEKLPWENTWRPKSF